MKSAIVIGGDSTIGGALLLALSSRNISCVGTGRRQHSSHLHLDLSAPADSWPDLPAADVAYFCAAMTKLDVCEKEREATRQVNVDQMRILAGKLQARGTFVIFLSSNQVFDGSRPYCKTTDAPHPMNEYGRQKMAFEALLLESGYPAAVLRLTKVIAAPLPMLAQWEAALRKKEAIEAFDDLVFAPLPLQSAIDGLIAIGEMKQAGIFHLSGTHDLSYYQIAQLLAAGIGADMKLVKPARATAKGILPQFLPKYATLESSRFKGIIIPPAEESIGLYNEGVIKP